MVIPRVLIVEDSLELIQLFSRVLARSGIPHVSTDTVPSAIAALRAQHFPLVLLDRQLGSASGFEVLAHIRAETIGRRSRVIIVSGEANQNGGPAGLDADGYLLKPVGVAQLLDVVSTELRAYDATPGD
jgi:DNA-binding response OmpR family regulator